MRIIVYLFCSPEQNHIPYEVHIINIIKLLLHYHNMFQNNNNKMLWMWWQCVVCLHFIYTTLHMYRTFVDNQYVRLISICLNKVTYIIQVIILKTWIHTLTNRYRPFYVSLISSKLSFEHFPEFFQILKPTQFQWAADVCR